MKWIVFAVAFAAVPPLALWLRQNGRLQYNAIMVLAALPFIIGVLPKSQIALSGDALWPGYVDGFEVSLLDLVAIAIYFALPRKKGSIPFKGPFALYILAIALSVTHAHFVTASLWYLWQCVRIFFFYSVIAKVCRDERGSNAVLKGLALGICLEGILVLWQRFVIHNPHAPGAFFHQNALGFVLHLAVLPVFAVALNDRKNWKYLIIAVLGVVCDVFTASRAALGLVTAGISLLLLVSIFRRWTAQKAKILASGLVFALILVPIVIRTYDIRAQAFGIGTDGGRASMNQGARLMSDAYPFGVGVNNFVLVAQREGYYWRAGVGYPNYNISPHNAYWTTLAETGYLGLFTLLLLLAIPLVTAASCGWRNRKDPRGDQLLGLAVALLLIALHSEYEWLLLSSVVQYVLAIVMGLIAGLGHQLGYWSASPERGYVSSGLGVSRALGSAGQLRNIGNPSRSGVGQHPMLGP